MKQYEQAFTRATQQEYPLSQGRRNQLGQQQQNLGLKVGDVAPIEARITAEVEAYQQNLQQYEQVLRQTIQHEYPLSDEIREELKRYQGVLELRDEDVARIEARVTSQDNASLSSDEDLGLPEIPIQEVQADFIKQPISVPKKPGTIVTTEPKTETSTTLDSIFLERCQRELTHYIGPIASFILEDTLAEYPRILQQQLVELLSTEIADPQNAKQFKEHLS